MQLALTPLLTSMGPESPFSQGEAALTPVLATPQPYTVVDNPNPEALAPAAQLLTLPPELIEQLVPAPKIELLPTASLAMTPFLSRALQPMHLAPPEPLSSPPTTLLTNPSGSLQAPIHGPATLPELATSAAPVASLSAAPAATAAAPLQAVPAFLPTEAFDLFEGPMTPKIALPEAAPSLVAFPDAAPAPLPVTEPNASLQPNLTPTADIQRGPTQEPFAIVPALPAYPAAILPVFPAFQAAPATSSLPMPYTLLAPETLEAKAPFHSPRILPSDLKFPVAGPQITNLPASGIAPEVATSFVQVPAFDVELPAMGSGQLLTAPELLAAKPLAPATPAPQVRETASAKPAIRLREAPGGGPSEAAVLLVPMTVPFSFHEPAASTELALSLLPAPLPSLPFQPLAMGPSTPMPVPLGPPDLFLPEASAGHILPRPPASLQSEPLELQPAPIPALPLQGERLPIYSPAGAEALAFKPSYLPSPVDTLFHGSTIGMQPSLFLPAFSSGLYQVPPAAAAAPALESVSQVSASEPAPATAPALPAPGLAETLFRAPLPLTPTPPMPRPEATPFSVTYLPPEAFIMPTESVTSLAYLLLPSPQELAPAVSEPFYEPMQMLLPTMNPEVFATHEQEEAPAQPPSMPPAFLLSAEPASEPSWRVPASDDFLHSSSIPSKILSSADSPNQNTRAHMAAQLPLSTSTSLPPPVPPLLPKLAAVSQSLPSPMAFHYSHLDVFPPTTAAKSGSPDQYAHSKPCACGAISGCKLDAAYTACNPESDRPVLLKMLALHARNK